MWDFKPEFGAAKFWLQIPPPPKKKKNSALNPYLNRWNFSIYSNAGFSSRQQIQDPVIYIYKLHYSVSSLFLLKFNISL